MSMRRAHLLVALVPALAVPAHASAAQLDTSLISRASGVSGASANDEARESSVSADGRYVAFRTAATNLVAADADATADIYVRDRQTGTTTLVSRATGAGGAKGNADSARPMISGDGRYVVFESGATNLHPDDGDAIFDVFVRDLQTDTTTLISRAGGAAGAKGTAQSFRPSISADGDRVAFQSSANNLSPDDTDNNGDVFVRDLSAATTTLVSRATGAGGANGNLEADDPFISADGGSVSFTSSSDNLHPDDTDNQPDVFVRSLGSSTTTLASRATGASGANSNQRAGDSSLSGDGSRVAFYSWADNLDPDDADTNSDIFVRDLGASTTTLISRATGAAGAKGGGMEPAISSDGNVVAFESFTANMDPADSDTSSDVFVRDLGASTTTLASRAAGAAGAKQNDNAELSQGGSHLSADGGFVVFDSSATNLSPDDTDAPQDVFIRQLGADPSFALTVTKAGTGGGTVTSDVAGIACGAACAASYSSGTVVTLTATPASGSDFTGWSGDCTGTATCAVTMSAARNVNATFQPPPPGGGAPPPPPPPGGGAPPPPPPPGGGGGEPGVGGSSSSVAALECTKRRLVLVDVLSRGGRVRLTGAADRRYVGRTVRLVFGATGRVVARAKVRRDGSFAATAPMPARRLRGTNAARYEARIGRERSLDLKLQRRMVLSSIVSRAGKVTIAGRVVGPLGSPLRAITLTRRVSCRRSELVARFRPRRDGRFRITVVAPKGRGAAVYRLGTKVRRTTTNPKLFPTFTLPRAVELR